MGEEFVHTEDNKVEYYEARWKYVHWIWLRIDIYMCKKEPLQHTHTQPKINQVQLCLLRGGFLESVAVPENFWNSLQDNVQIKPNNT